MRFLLFIFIFGSLSSMASVKGEKLLDAVFNSDVEEVQKLLNEGVDPKKVRDKDGRTPLHYAVRFSYLKMIKILLDAGVDPNKKNRFGVGPLHWAKFQPARMLIAAGADPKVKVGAMMYTRLHTSVLIDTINQAELLFKTHGKISVREALNEVIKQVQILLEKDVNDPDIRAKLSEFRLTKLLLDKGVDPKAENKRGETPFQLLTKNTGDILEDLVPACINAFKKKKN